MPNLKDAPVLLAGTVIDSAVLTKRGTGEFDGRKITVMVAGDTEPGFAVVKFNAEESQAFGPEPLSMSDVTWWVRSAPYAVEANTGMSTRFIREVTVADLEKIHTRLSAKAAAKN